MIYRAILVDPWEQAILPVSYDEENRLTKMISCANNKVEDLDVRSVAEGIMMCVDDIGGLKPDLPVFRITGYRDPIPGCALFLGVGPVGETQDIPTGFMNFIKSRIQWTDLFTTGKLEPDRFQS